MNPQTGEIRCLPPGARPRGQEIPLGCLPDPNCKKCLGVGWKGRFRDTGEVIPCPCVKPQGAGRLSPPIP